MLFDKALLLGLLFSIHLLVIRGNPLPKKDEEKPEPYSFSFDGTDEFGTRIARSEKSDEKGVVEGSYSYSDANGMKRTVNYIADENGFRANILSNEPGILASEPAAAKYSLP